MCYQAITEYDTTFHKAYFYHLIGFFGFSFYGIWVQILLKALFPAINGYEGLAVWMGHLLSILSIPFLLLSWIMLVRMGYSLLEQLPKKMVWLRQTGWLGIGVLLILAGFIWLGEKTGGSWQKFIRDEMAALMLADLLFLIFFSGTILRGFIRYTTPQRRLLTRFVLLMLLGWALRGAALPLLFEGPWLPAPALLVYFLSACLPFLYIRQYADLLFTPVFAGHPNEARKVLLCERYEISPREREIVDKICEGKTNRQIADELFISLQTVKDHTHRIYSKIGIHSRLKLVQLVNG